MKTAKRQAREIALQALYAWQLSGGDPVEQARSLEDFDKIDAKFVEGAAARRARSRARARADASRRTSTASSRRLSPVERAILFIGAYELAAHPKTPFKVVLNEAIELGKSFGGTDGHRFVNGVLEKIAIALRPEEVARDSEPTSERIRAHPPLLRPAAEARAGRRSATTARCCAPTPGLELAVTTDMLVEGRHFLPGADPRSARPQGARRQPFRPRGDGRGAALGDARARAARGRRALAGGVRAGLLRACRALRRRSGRRRHHAQRRCSPSASRRWARCRRASRCTAPARARATTSGCRASSAARRSVSRGRSLPPSRRGCTGPSRASSSASGCAASRARRSTFPTGWRATSGHILERSQVGAVVEYARIPRPAAFEKFRELERDCVLSGGDDYELAVHGGAAAAPRDRGAGAGAEASR